MSKKKPNISTATKPVVLRPSNGNQSYLKHRVATNKKIAGHQHRSG